MRIIVHFPMIWGSGGSKSRLAKAAGAEAAGQMRDEKLHAIVAPITFPSQNVQNTLATMVGPLFEKVHAVVGRSTFRCQNVQNTPFSDHFWKLRCRKSARRWGAKHISNKMYKTFGVRTTFGGSDVASLHYTTLHSTTLHYITLHYTPLHNTTSTTTQLHSTTLHYTKLRYTTLNYTTLHYITLHYTTLPSTTLHYTKLHYTPLHYNYNYNYTTTLHYTPLH